MSFSDPLIIYLAIGSPFAVHDLLRSSQAFSFRSLSMAVLVWLFWPVYTIWLLTHSNTSRRETRIYSPDYASLDAAIAQRVDELRVKMERAVSGRSIFEFREVFERYVALTSVGTQTPSSATEDAVSPFADILSLTKKEADMNALCLNRHNRRQLEFHQIRARNDLLAFSADIADPEFDRLGSRLAELLADPSLAEELRAGQIADPNSVVTESELWHSEKPQTSIANAA